MTENATAAKRASTRSTRASAVNQERKQLVEATQSLPLAPEAVPSSTSSANAKPDTPASSVATPSETEPTEPVAEDSSHTPQQAIEATSDSQASGRRSARRSAQAVPANGAAASEETTDETTAAETTTQEISASEGLSALASANADAVAEFVTNGGSLTAAATRFGLSRAEVTKIVKDTTVSGSSAKEAGSDESMEGTSADDKTSDKPAGSEPPKNDAPSSEQSKNDEASSQDTTTATTTNTAAATVSSTPTTSSTTTVTPTTFTSLLESNDLKRGAAAMTEAGSAEAAGLVPKAKRVRKTREEKLAILAFVDDGGTHVAAAEKFGVSRTAVTKMVKERDIILSGPPGKPGIVIGVPTTAAAASPAAPTARTPPVAATVTPQSTEAAPTPAPRKTRAANTSAAKPPSAAGTPTSGNPKAKRVRKTNEEKLLILEFVERGGSQGAAAEKFGVSRTAVTKMVKEKEAITAQVMSGKSNHRKVLQYQHKLSIIEDMLYKWQVQVESDAPNLKVTGDLLQSKAVEFRDKILAEWKNSLEPEVVHSLSEFKASNGWLHRYLQRRNLRTASKREYHRRVGPTGGAVPVNSSDPFNISMFLDDVTVRLKAVPVHCIWNMDEVSLLARTLTAPPAPTDESLPEPAPVGRMTVSLLVNAAGEKFKPQVLIAESNMEKMEALQKAHPELYIASQQYAWQDTTSLALYLHSVSAEAKKRMETWSIVMDASPSHIEFAQLVDPSGSFERGYRFEDLVLILLPPQSTPTNQPLHHGVARVFKAAFRQSMLSDIGEKLANSDTPSQFDFQTQISDADQVSWVSRAWNVTPTTLVRHCWVRNGLLSGPQLAQISQDNSRASEAEHFRALCDTVKALREERGGVFAQTLGLAVPSGQQSETESSESILDQVNALISLEDNELTERKHVMLVPETDANGDMRVLV